MHARPQGKSRVSVARLRSGSYSTCTSSLASTRPLGALRPGHTRWPGSRAADARTSAGASAPRGPRSRRSEPRSCLGEADGAGPCTGRESLSTTRARPREACPDGAVESFTDVSSGREHESLLIRWDRPELMRHSFPRPRCHAAVKDDEMSSEPPQLLGKVLEVVAPLGRQDRRPALFKARDRVVQD